MSSGLCQELGWGLEFWNRRNPQHTCPHSPGRLEEAEILGERPEVLLLECEVVGCTEECMETRKVSDLFGAKLCLGKEWAREKGDWSFSSLGLPLSVVLSGKPFMSQLISS